MAFELRVLEVKLFFLASNHGQTKGFQGDSAWNSQTLCMNWIHWNHYEEHNEAELKFTTLSEDLYIKFSSLRDRKATSSQIQNWLNKQSKTPISKNTVRRKLCCSGLRGRTIVSKPLLRRVNKAKCLERARKYQQFTVDDWKEVLFTDESRFEIYVGNRRV